MSAMISARDLVKRYPLPSGDVAAVAGIDLEVAAGFMPTPFPVVAGHEGAGVVELVGAAVTGFSPGDRVVASFSFCGGNLPAR